jgi:hypothetical protein
VLCIDSQACVGGGGTLANPNVGNQKAYFSVNGGATVLYAFNSDPAGDLGDLVAPGNSYDAFSGAGTVNSVTSNDLILMNVLGYNPPGAKPTPPPIFSTCTAGTYNAGFGVITVPAVAPNGSFIGTYNNGAQGVGPFYDISGSCTNGNISFSLYGQGTTNVLESWTGSYTASGSMSGSFTYKTSTISWSANPVSASSVCQAGTYNAGFGVITIPSVATGGAFTGTYNNGAQGVGPFYAIEGICLNDVIVFVMPQASTNSILETWWGSYNSSGDMSGSFMYKGTAYSWSAQP